MSPEHSFLESSQSAAQEATFFGGGDQINPPASNLEPIEVIRARQAIAAAIAPVMPSGSLEVHKVEITRHEKIADVSWRLSLMRSGSNLDVDDIFAMHPRVLKTEAVNSAVDHAIEAEFFHAPAEIRPTDTQDNFGLTA
jgi:hypothetical protein